MTEPSVEHRMELVKELLLSQSTDLRLMKIQYQGRPNFALAIERDEHLYPLMIGLDDEIAVDMLDEDGMAPKRAIDKQH